MLFRAHRPDHEGGDPRASQLLRYSPAVALPMGGGASALDPDKVPAQYIPPGGFREEPFHVFLEMTIDGEAAGRMVVNLRADVCPMACENFRLLCTGESGHGYEGSAFHLHVVHDSRHDSAPPLPALQ